MSNAHPAKSCFNTQPPEGGWISSFPILIDFASFNTQPPEGGWFVLYESKNMVNGFNTQPPEGGWYKGNSKEVNDENVSTHSRPKAAGY